MAAPGEDPVTDIFEICDRHIAAYCELDPAAATAMGVPGFDDRWGDHGPASIDAWLELAAATEAEIDALPPAGGHFDALARRVAKESFALSREIIASGHVHRTVSSIVSGAGHLSGVLDQMPTSDEEGWRNLAARLSTIDEPMADWRTMLEIGRDAGNVVARRQAEAVIEQCRTWAEGFARFSGEGAGLDEELGTALRSAIDHARSVYLETADWLEDAYLPHTIDEDAVGVDRYRFEAKRYLGTEIDLAETYRWGWSEVRRLRAEMEELAEQVSPGAGLDAVMEALKTDPDRVAPTPEAFLERMSALQVDAIDRLDGVHFDLPDEIKPLDVRMAPPGGSLGAYYTGPTEDFGRPGTVWYSPGDKTEFPLFDEVSTAYHEGFPGHHYQVAIATYLADRLSRLHRLAVWYPGFGEGWALYAEHLMGELGFYDRPDYEIGLRINQIHRACRVAIDIGYHCGFPIPEDAPFHPGEEWSFDTATGLLRAYAYLSEPYAVSEVTRFLGWPGQAISYKVGERVILELRDEYMRRPGATLKDFHFKVVGSGAVGLDHLRELVLAD